MGAVSWLAAVGECVLSGGFRATVLTRPVGVIDGAVRVVAGVRATDALVLRRERLERPVVSRGCDGGHVFAKGVPVDVVRARTSHQFLDYVVDGDSVLVGCGVLVALVGDANESGGIDVEDKLFGLCAFRCRLVSFKGYG